MGSNNLFRDLFTILVLANLDYVSLLEYFLGGKGTRQIGTITRLLLHNLSIHFSEIGNIQLYINSKINHKMFLLVNSVLKKKTVPIFYDRIY